MDRVQNKPNSSFSCNSQSKCSRTHVGIDIFSCFGMCNTCPKLICTFQLQLVYGWKTWKLLGCTVEHYNWYCTLVSICCSECTLRIHPTSETISFQIYLPSQLMTFNKPQLLMCHEGDICSYDTFTLRTSCLIPSFNLATSSHASLYN
jgi:hypothetical protein